MKENEELSKELIIDVKANEIVIALLENKQLVELSKEKSNLQFTVGDIYLGRIKRITAGLNAAFVDVGYKRDAFLHYLDLGPQFQTQNKLLKLAISGKQDLPTLQNLPSEPDTDKNGKISDVLELGQLVLVQIAKEPIATKGPRLSSEISIAGRNLVLMPFANKVSISQKIKSSEEKERLKRLMKSIKPKNYGVIVRTVAKNRSVAVLDTELRSLVSRWENAFEKLKNSDAPQLVMGELNRTSAILRDILNSSFTNIYVNNQKLYDEIVDYINKIAPEKQKIVRLYNTKTPIFEYYGINKQIKSLFGKTLTIKNGAYLIIEHTEALHAIDVNSGNRSKKTNDQETNALEVNLAAADEIARQLRLRDMGGIIVIDFIDMNNQEHRQILYERVKEVMGKDRTKHNILPLSKFGLMQITRQRVRPEMNIETTETCPACGGTGEVSPSVLFIDDLESNLNYIVNRLEKKLITIRLHPYVAAYLTKGLFSHKLRWWWQFKTRIKIEADYSYTYFEAHFYDANEVEIKI